MYSWVKQHLKYRKFENADFSERTREKKKQQRRKQLKFCQQCVYQIFSSPLANITKKGVFNKYANLNINVEIQSL